MIKLQPILIVSLLTTLLYSTLCHSSECNYQKLRTQLDTLDLNISKEINDYYGWSDKKIKEFSSGMGVPEIGLRVNAMHKEEYLFSNLYTLTEKTRKSGDIKGMFTQFKGFTLLRYTTEAEAQITYQHLKGLQLQADNDKSPNKGCCPPLLILSSDTPVIELFGRNIAFYAPGESNSKDIAKLVKAFSSCSDFDPDMFKVIQMQAQRLEDAKAGVRDSKKETEALHETMYTSEMAADNALDGPLELLSTDYRYKDGYLTGDQLPLHKVVVTLKNKTKNAFKFIEVFVVYYGEHNKLLEVKRSTAYSVEGHEDFEVESELSYELRSKAYKAYVLFAITKN